MTSKMLVLCALSLFAAACQTTETEQTSFVAPEVTAQSVSYDEEPARSSGDYTDPGVRVGKPGDNELPEGARMLDNNEDPTALTNADDGQVLCKRIKVTGTRITTQRVCKTRRMWKEYDDQTRLGVRRQMDRNQKGKPQG